jgi:hypothetical protein
MASVLRRAPRKNEKILESLAKTWGKWPIPGRNRVGQEDDECGKNGWLRAPEQNSPEFRLAARN